MPFDKYFSSKHKRGIGAKARRAAIAAKYSWPEGSQNGPKVAIEMRGPGRPDWWHIADTPAKHAAEDVEMWERANPGYEFRALPPPSKPEPPVPKEPRRALRWQSHEPAPA